MRERWSRGQPALDLSREDVAALIPDRTVLSIAHAAGGLANTNLRVDTATGPVLLRLWTRDPTQAAKELALLALVADRVPVPRVLHAVVTGRPYAVMEWVDAARLDQVRPSPALARAIGATLAAIHSFTFPRTGFLDERLEVAQPVPVDGAGVLAFLRAVLVDGPGRNHLADPALVDAVLRDAERDGVLLHDWTGPPCLTHSDFNGSNVLVRGDAVVAVLDWEFAFSGAPFVDFGNLLRPPRGDDDGFAAAVADGYGPLPRAWRRMSRLADLMAWADFLSRPNPGPALVADARMMFQRFVSGA